MSEENKDTEVSVAELQAELAKKEELLAETRKEAAERRIKLKDFEGVDVEEYKTLKATAAELKQKELETSGNFEAAKEAIVKSYEDKLSDKDNRIMSLEDKYKSVVITDKLVSEASKQNAMNPTQVAVLLKDNIKLNDSGNVEIIGADGKVRFNDKGDPISVDAFVSEFLTENKFMIRGVESGSGSAGGDHKVEDAPKSAFEKIASGFSKK